MKITGHGKAMQGDSGHSQADMSTEIYGHILDANRRKNDEYEIAINDLSGALALPLISELFAEYQNVEALNILLQMLTMLYNNGCGVRAFDLIYTLFRTSAIAGVL